MSNLAQGQCRATQSGRGELHARTTFDSADPETHHHRRQRSRTRYLRPSRCITTVDLVPSQPARSGKDLHWNNVYMRTDTHAMGLLAGSALALARPPKGDHARTLECQGSPTSCLCGSAGHHRWEPWRQSCWVEQPFLARRPATALLGPHASSRSGHKPAFMGATIAAPAADSSVAPGKRGSLRRRRRPYPGCHRPRPDHRRWPGHGPRQGDGRTRWVG